MTTVGVLLLLLGAVYLVVYAGSQDPYFSPARSRWDYSATNGSRPVLVAALVIGVAAAMTLVLTSRSRGSLRVGAVVLAGIAVGLDLVAYVAISIGH